MTVSYNQDIHKTHSLTFMKVIFRWRGSLWKSVLYEVTIWLLCFYTVMFVYRKQMEKRHQIQFEHIAKHTDGKMDYIPLSFMHGFYVAFVVDRWKQIFANIGFVDSAAFWISTYVVGEDYESRTYRRNLIRYFCLTQVMVLRDISISVRRRFPTMESLVECGLLQTHESEMMSSIHSGFPRYWMPIHWIFTLSYQLMKSGKLASGHLDTILGEAKLFREKLQLLINYDWVPVPLAYSQVVFMATRVYFFLCLFTRQFRIWEQKDSVVYIEYYFPLMTFLQLICYMGWLKVAESLLNPLGDDDEDFECSYIIDRNLAIGMTMVDECYGQMPCQIPDKFGREGEIPPMYTEQNASDPEHQLVGSAKLAAENNPSEFVDPIPDRRASTFSIDRKRSIFKRMAEQAVGGRIESPAEDIEQKNNRRASTQEHHRSVATPFEDSMEVDNDVTRKSKSIACAPFATSCDRPNLSRKIRTMPPNGIEQLQLNGALDKQNLDENIQIPSSPAGTHQSANKFELSNGTGKQLETLSEEDDEQSTGSNASSSTSRSGNNKKDKDKKEEK